jgi:hypothetical protein
VSGGLPRRSEAAPGNLAQQRLVADRQDPRRFRAVPPDLVQHLQEAFRWASRATLSVRSRSPSHRLGSTSGAPRPRGPRSSECTPRDRPAAGWDCQARPRAGSDSPAPRTFPGHEYCSGQVGHPGVRDGTPYFSRRRNRCSLATSWSQRRRRSPLRRSRMMRIEASLSSRLSSGLKDRRRRWPPYKSGGK